MSHNWYAIDGRRSNGFRRKATKENARWQRMTVANRHRLREEQRARELAAHRSTGPKRPINHLHPVPSTVDGTPVPTVRPKRLPPPDKFGRWRDVGDPVLTPVHRTVGARVEGRGEQTERLYGSHLDYETAQMISSKFGDD